MENNELKHWGVKGMRWGVRRYQNKDGTLTPLGKKREAAKDNDSNGESKNAKAKTRPKKISEMTDAELREKIQRLELEKRLKDLGVDDAKSKSEEAKKFVSEVLKDSGKDLAKQVVKHLGAKALNKMLNETETKTVKKKVIDKKTGEEKEVEVLVKELKEVIFANNKKK